MVMKKIPDVIPLNEMAFDRDKYRSVVRHATLGALGEYMKFRVAKDAGLETDRKNGHLVAHWDLEWRRLLSKGLEADVIAQVKFGKNRRLPTAIAEVERLRFDEDVDRKYAAKAVRVVNQDFGSDIHGPVTPNSDSFWEEVDRSIRSMLDPDYLL